MRKRLLKILTVTVAMLTMVTPVMANELADELTISAETAEEGGELTIDRTEINVKENGQANVSVTDSVENYTYEATSSVASVASVGIKAGNTDVFTVKAKSYGTTIVTITEKDDKGVATGKTATVPVNVYCSTFSVDNVTLAKGNSKNVTPTFTEGYSFDVANMNFISGNTNVVTTSGNKLTAVNKGTAVVTAKLLKDYNAGATEDITKTFTVTVNNPVTSIETVINQATLFVGKTAQIGASALPEDASDKTLKYESANESIATVSNDGIITAKAKGTTVVTVKTMDGSNLSKEIRVTVNMPVTSISANDIDLYSGQEASVNATVSNDASDKTLSYTSKDSAIATVDADGKVKAIKPGKTEITIKANDGSEVEKKISVNVKGQIKKLTSAATSISVDAGKDVILSYTVDVTNNENYKDLLSQTLSDTSVVKIKDVTYEGTKVALTLSGLKEGLAILTVASKNVTDENVSFQVPVSVNKVVVPTPTPAPTQTEKKDQIMTGNDTYAVTFGCKPFTLDTKTNGTGKLTYASSNTAIASVDENGLVTVKKSGSATITVIANESTENNAASYKVNIKVAKAAQKLTVKASKSTVKYSKVKKAKQSIKLTVKGAKGKVTYKSSSKKVTVSKTGKVTIKKGTKKGTYKITVTAAAKGDYKKTSKVVKIKVK